ncbi:hypothetical protein Nepgr_014452 [Nepenthes gracilis]|uniref:Uncharacterized protein n=1 Tax=Nepenthes gracilis TaxID=150966 RepID=A0AAD3SLV8_NEPGR|nr:hypothetical protein Nepgr_014452 [Nepenthes gracilis]
MRTASVIDGKNERRKSGKKERQPLNPSQQHDIACSLPPPPRSRDVSMGRRRRSRRQTLTMLRLGIIVEPFHSRDGPPKEAGIWSMP